jgi:CHASE2 domain-containing sensor protein
MLFAFFVLGVIGYIGLNLNFFSPFKNAFQDFSYLDLYYAEKLEAETAGINKDIILINIERRNRKEIAALLEKLGDSGPKVIGLDVIFKDLQDPVWDQFLAKFLKGDKTVATYVFDQDKKIGSNKKIVHEQLDSGYSNFNFDDESAVIRNFRGVLHTPDSVHFAFGTVVAKKFMGQKWNDHLEAYLEKDRPINYSGNRGNFLLLEYNDVMEAGTSELLKDKIVLLGYLGNEKYHPFDMEDKHFTPMNPKFVGKSPPDTFGLVIHANIIRMLIEKDFIYEVPNWVGILLTVFLTYLALCYFIWLNKKQLASYILRLNVVQLVFIIFFVWISLLLFKQRILFKTAPIVAIMVFSIGLIGFYKKLAHYLYKRYRWQGYFFHD